jgi:hypothetical protein
MYEAGDGVPRDHKRALYWHSLSSGKAQPHDNYPDDYPSAASPSAHPTSNSGSQHSASTSSNSRKLHQHRPKALLPMAGEFHTSEMLMQSMPVLSAPSPDPTHNATTTVYGDNSNPFLLTQSTGAETNVAAVNCEPCSTPSASSAHRYSPFEVASPVVGNDPFVDSSAGFAHDDHMQEDHTHSSTESESESESESACESESESASDSSAHEQEVDMEFVHLALEQINALLVTVDPRTNSESDIQTKIRFTAMMLSGLRLLRPHLQRQIEFAVAHDYSAVLLQQSIEALDQVECICE